VDRLGKASFQLDKWGWTTYKRSKGLLCLTWRGDAMDDYIDLTIEWTIDSGEEDLDLPGVLRSRA